MADEAVGYLLVSNWVLPNYLTGSLPHSPTDYAHLKHDVGQQVDAVVVFADLEDSKDSGEAEDAQHRQLASAPLHREVDIERHLK